MSKTHTLPAAKPRKAPEAPLHYTASGLDDVWLMNGFTLEATPYGEGVSIQDADALHDTLAQVIATGNAALRPAELRFLRKHVGLSQEGMARMLGCSSQSVARWEKGQVAVDPSAERLVRFIVMEFLGKEWAMLKALEDLAQADTANPTERRLRHRAGAWKRAA